MYRFERPRDFDRRYFDEPRFSSASAVKLAVFLPLLAAYGLGFVVLYPAAQASASKSAAGGNDPIAFVGP
jgi:hypothetical protein